MNILIGIFIALFAMACFLLPVTIIAAAIYFLWNAIGIYTITYFQAWIGTALLGIVVWWFRRR